MKSNNHKCKECSIEKYRSEENKMSAVPFILFVFLGISSTFATPLRFIDKNNDVDFVIEADYLQPVCGTFKNISCALCTFVVDHLNTLVQQQANEEDIADFIAKLCISLKIQDENVCIGIAHEYKVITNSLYC